MQGDPRFVVSDAAGEQVNAHEWGDGHAIDHKTALQFVIAWLQANLAGTKLVAAGHRVLLGGARFEAPVRIDADVLAYLDGLVAMETIAPALQCGRDPSASARHFPACCKSLASIARSIERCLRWRRPTRCPRTCAIHGLRHWGYHGISYDYISRQDAEVRSRGAAG